MNLDIINIDNKSKNKQHMKSRYYHACSVPFYDLGIYCRLRMNSLQQFKKCRNCLTFFFFWPSRSSSPPEPGQFFLA
eukprot:c38762_g1_i1 orf=192-422(+)